MYTVQLLLAAAVLSVVISDIKCHVTPEAGKCHSICVDSVPIDFITLAYRGKYDVLYATFIDNYAEQRDEVRTAIPISDGVFRGDYLRTYPNGTTSRKTYTVSYVDNVVVEEMVDEEGVRHQSRNYVLATTKEDAVLYYRCSDTGSPDIDFRGIVIQKGNTLGKEGLEYLMAVDKKCNFKGNLKKIPKGLIK